MASGLRPAHEGYRHQDLLSALAVLRVLTGELVRVAIDRKTIDDDPFDDIALVTESGEERRVQIKSSKDTAKVLELVHFKNDSSDIRLSRLLQAHRSYGVGGPEEYRLCVTWAAPIDGLRGMLRQASIPEFVPGTGTQRYMLDPDVAWPEDGAPLIPLGPCSRCEFEEFCKRFVIETGMPPVQSLWNQGPLERALLQSLQRDIGVSAYPNNKNIIDFAAHAIGLATWARANDPELTAREIESRLQLRIDYGRVEQQYPIDGQVLQRRASVDDWLGTLIVPGGRFILTGAPGAGKSWLLTDLATRFEQNGAIVARHYCYLEPGDEWIEQRVKHDILFGNLIAEIMDAAPQLRTAMQRRYAATATELEQLMAAAATRGKSAVLIVDGLDHIGRVRSSSRALSDEETGIVERLAALDLPDQSIVIIGSQPGSHLEDLTMAGYVSLEIPPWTIDEMVALEEALGVRDSISELDDSSQTTIIVRLAEFAEGNPLCATLLSRELVELSGQGNIDPREWIASLPTIQGQVRQYYGYLYSAIAKDRRAVAELLAVLDFSVSKQELCELVGPLLSLHVGEILTQLRPILRNTVGGGGVRIFHESFRRFILDELEMSGKEVAILLNLIIAHLENKGFQRDQRAYRYLIPLLLQAGRHTHAFALVGPSFVVSSVAEGHAFDAIRRNITLVARTAAALPSWENLITCIELSRQLDETWRSLGEEALEYWQAMVVYRGPHFVVERLLYEGRPTLDKWSGLLVCEQVSRSGAVPPWSEYLELPELEPNDDGNGDLAGRVSLARLRGRIAVDGWKSCSSKVMTFLAEYDGAEYDVAVEGRAYLDALFILIGETVGLDAVHGLLEHTNADLVFSLATRCRLALFVAESSGEPLVLQLETRHWDELPTDLLRRALDQGCTPPDSVVRSRDPGEIELGFSDRKTAERSNLTEWLERVRVAARAAPDLLDLEEAKRLSGDGWYRSWLRFSVLISKAELFAGAKRSGANVHAFRELTQSANPFAGSPRPVDLHGISDVIFSSLDLGLRGINSTQDWAEALRLLGQAADKTSATLWRSPWGPLPLEKQLGVLEPYASDPAGGALVREFIVGAVEQAKAHGTYYGYHARHALYACRMLSACGSDVAASKWEDAAIFLCAYGHHKDRTLFELLESAPALLNVNKEAALDAVAALQVMAETLLDHTDGRETGHAPNAWFRALAAIDLPLATEILADTRQSLGDATGSYVEKAVVSCLEYARNTASVSVMAWCWSIVPFEPDYDEGGVTLARSKVDSARNLTTLNNRAGLLALRLATAQIANDARAHDAEAIRWLARQPDVASRDLPDPLPGNTNTGLGDLASLGGEVSFESRLQREFPVPLFRADSSPREILRGIREWAEPDLQRGQSELPALLNALGYRLVELHAQGGDAIAIRLIREFARSGWITDQDPPLAAVADGLLRLGAQNLACVAYTLAYARTRGEGGWSPVGGSAQEHLLAKAVRIDRQLTLSTLASEIVEIVGELPGGIGVTKNLVERMAALGEPELAQRMWWAAYDVIERRVPLRSAAPEVFSALLPDARASWTVDEGLFALLLTELNHPRLSRKLRAALAIQELLRTESLAFEAPVSWFCSINCLTSSMIIVLQIFDVLSEYGVAPGPKMIELLRELAVGGSWSAKRFARNILARYEDLAPMPEFAALSPSPSRDHASEGARRRFELSLDDGMRAALDRIPGAEDWVYARFARLLESNDLYAGRRRHRALLAWGDRGESEPITPVLFWEQELLLGLVDEVMNHLRPHLWRAGSWSEDAESEVLAVFAPHLSIHLAYLASRRPRPPREVPGAPGWGVSDVPQIVAGRDFEGWRVFGYHEDFWVPGEAYLRGPRAVRFACSGAVVRPIGEEIPQDVWPFGTMEHLGLLPARAFVGMLSGPLCILQPISDWLGSSMLLVLAPGLTDLLGLEMTIDEGGVQWRDQSGEARAVLRSWIVRDKQQYEAAPARAIGEELLVEPSVVAIIEQSLGGVLCQIECCNERRL